MIERAKHINRWSIWTTSGISRLRRQGIAALAEMDHNGLDRETIALAREIYAQVLRVKGEPFPYT